MGRRYAPLLILAAVQLLLVIIAPSRGINTRFNTGDRGGAGQSGEAADQTIGPAEGSFAGPGGSTLSGTGQAGPAASRTPGFLTEDKSKCAAGGVLQQKITRISPRCVGKWVGNSTGATSRGVTAEEVTVVFVRANLPEFIERILVAGNLGSTREIDEEHLRVWGKFFEKHYEYFGRRIKWVIHQNACAAGDPNPVGCIRQEARTIVTKYNPFYVYAFQVAVPEFFDELSRLGVVNNGTFHAPASFHQGRRPFHWGPFADGDRLVRNVSDYWCKKMHGKKATLAGDPLIQALDRRLGIIAIQGTGVPEITATFEKAVSGGMCGTSANKPVTVFVSDDITQASQQMTAAATTFSQAEPKVTTVVCMCTALYPIFMTQAFDDQRYFPEHLISGGYATDVNQLGRLYKPTQWKNAFGPGMLPNGIAVGDSDQERSYRDGSNGGNTTCAVCGGMFLFMNLVAHQVQLAGPSPTPLTLERGTLTSPPIGGWFVSGGDPTTPMWKFGPSDYTAYEDARHTYWDPSATGPDGQAGAYKEVEGGRRYEIGTWTSGEPKK